MKGFMKKSLLIAPLLLICNYVITMEKNEIFGLQENVTMQLDGQLDLKYAYGASIYYNPEQNIIVTPVTPEDSGSLGIYSTQGKKITTLPGNNQGTVWDLKHMEGNDNQLIVCRGADSNCCIDYWDLNQDTKISQSDVQLAKILYQAIGFINSSGQQVLVAVGGNGLPYYDNPIISFFDAASGKKIKDITQNHTAELVSIQKSPEINNFVTSQVDGKIFCIWDLEGNSIATITNSSMVASSFFKILQHKQLGTFIITMDADLFLNFWSQKYDLYATYKWTDTLTALEISPDKKQIAVGGYNGTLTLFALNNIKGIKPITQLNGHTQTINALKFVQNYILSASGNDYLDTYDNTVRLWDLKGNQLAVFSPDGNYNAITALTVFDPNNFAASSSCSVVYFVELTSNNKVKKAERSRRDYIRKPWLAKLAKLITELKS